MYITDRDQSLHSNLITNAMGSRETRTTRNTGKREVYCLYTGAIVGQFTAHEAWAFLGVESD